MQLGKENTPSTEPSPFCQLPCFPPDLLFLHSITAEQRHNKETEVISGG